MRTATELEAHVAAGYSVVFIGATLAAGLAAGRFWHGRRSSSRRGQGPDPTLPGGLILALAIAWLGLILLVNGLEGYRGWLVANFVHPPALTRLLILAPVAIGLAAVGLFTWLWTAALLGGRRALGDTNARPMMLWIAIALGLLGGVVVTVSATRVRVVEWLALLASFAASLVAALGRAPDAHHTGMPSPQSGRAQESGPSPREFQVARQAVGVTMLALWIGWTTGSACRVLPATWSRGTPAAADHAPASGLRALIRSWQPDAIFVLLGDPTAHPHATAAREADLGGVRTPLVVIMDARARETVSADTAARAVRRAARALLRGGLMLIESDNMDALAAAMELAPADHKGIPTALVVEFRTPSGTQRILAVGPAVPDWLSTRPLPEGTTTQLRPVHDAAAAKRLLERHRPVG